MSAAIDIPAEIEKAGEIGRLALQLADEAGISDIECWTQSHAANPSDEFRWWYDTTDCDDVCEEEGVETQLRYLRLRGLIIDHPTNPGWVRFPKEAA